MIAEDCLAAGNAVAHNAHPKVRAAKYSQKSVKPTFSALSCPKTLSAAIETTTKFIAMDTKIGRTGSMLDQKTAFLRNSGQYAGICRLPCEGKERDPS